MPGKEHNLFFDPKDWGCFKLGSTQSVSMLFKWDNPVKAGSKVVAVDNGQVIKTYVAGDGLTLSNGDQDVSIELEGADFPDHINCTLRFECCFFLNHTDNVFDLIINKAHI